MPRTFELIRDYYTEKDYIYKRKTATFNPGLTILVGCNGSGKTTLLHQLSQNLGKLNIPVFSWDNYHEGGSHAMDTAGFDEDFRGLAAMCQSSEGERILFNFGDVAKRLGNFVRQHNDSNEIWILLDAMDSGLSIDGVLEVKDFFGFLQKEIKGKDVYIIASANEYELARDNDCYSVIDLKYVGIDSYEEYKKLILKSRAHKDKRYSK